MNKNHGPERHFHEQLGELKRMLIKMAAMVDQAIRNSIEALIAFDAEIAAEVIHGDDEINITELMIDEVCLKLFALQQPVAIDLRFIMSAMKINNDLERMGDHAVNIAQRAIIIQEQKKLEPVMSNLTKMAKVVQLMVHDSLHSFVHGDVEKARQVCIRDSEVDQLEDDILSELNDLMMQNKNKIPTALNLALINKNLERIADLSTNISEEVFFIYDAKILKHHLAAGTMMEDIRPR